MEARTPPHTPPRIGTGCEIRPVSSCVIEETAADSRLYCVRDGYLLFSLSKCPLFWNPGHATDLCRIGLSAWNFGRRINCVAIWDALLQTVFDDLWVSIFFNTIVNVHAAYRPTACRPFLRTKCFRLIFHAALIFYKLSLSHGDMSTKAQPYSIF